MSARACEVESRGSGKKRLELAQAKLRGFESHKLHRLRLALTQRDGERRGASAIDRQSHHAVGVEQCAEDAALQAFMARAQLRGEIAPDMQEARRAAATLARSWRMRT